MYNKFMLIFEESLYNLENELEKLKNENNQNINSEVLKIEKNIQVMMKKIYSNLEPWQYLLIARHINRPTGSDYIKNLITDFFPISGDRFSFEDKALLAGIGKLNDTTVAVIGHNKGHDLNQRLENNFGMAHPQGYHKAIRLFKIASKLNIPIISFIDTKGAAANKESEENGQGFALAACIKANFDLTVPLISIIVGEGGSGGAIALASGHYTAMLKYSIFSVASPNACSAILWKNKESWKESANMLKITAQDLLNLKAIDEEIDEPCGGAHRFPAETYQNMKNALSEILLKFKNITKEELKKMQINKYEKF